MSHFIHFIQFLYMLVYVVSEKGSKAETYNSVLPFQFFENNFNYMRKKHKYLLL